MTYGRRSSARAAAAGTVAVDSLKVLLPFAKAVPLAGDLLGASIETVLGIVEINKEVETLKRQCTALTDRAYTVTAAIITELMKGDPKTLPSRELKVKALNGTLVEIQKLLESLTDVSLWHRVTGRDKVKDRISNLTNRLNNAIDAFGITSLMRFDDALAELHSAMAAAKAVRDLADLHHFLNPVGAASFEARHPESGCLSGTRDALLEKISVWFNDEDPEVPQIFWLSGLAGTGKTTVSHTICDMMKKVNRLGAAFFFSRDSADQRRVSSVIPTLAYQLAAVRPELRSEICASIQKYPHAPGSAQKLQFDYLLKEPLFQLSANTPTLLVVLDALDECDKERGKEGGDLLELLFAEVPQRKLRLKVLVTSRPERSIEETFKRTGGDSSVYRPSILHEVDQSMVKRDIELYLTHHLHRIQMDRAIQPPWPADYAMSLLLARAGLLFIFAATMVNYLADSYYTPQEQLRRLLEEAAQPSSTYVGVDELYLHILQRMVEGRRDQDLLCKRFRDIVGAIVVAQDPMSITTLAALMRKEEDEVLVALLPLRSVLVLNPSDRSTPIRIFHPSFRDFLLSPERCTDARFAISEAEIHGQLAGDCLAIMINNLKRDICDIGDEPILNEEIPQLQAKLKERISPALSYACRHWGAHLSKSAQDPTSTAPLKEQLSAFTSRRLLNWIEAISLSGQFSSCIANLGLAEDWCRVNSIRSDTSSLIYDAYRLVLDFQKVIRESTMQLYASALTFIPNCTLLRYYQSELGSSVRMTTPRMENWDVCNLALEGHTGAVRALSFYPGGTRLVSGSEDNDLRLWNLADGQCLMHLCGHSGPVNSVSVSKDGGYIASGSDDGTIRTWHAVTGQCLSVFEKTRGSVMSVAFSADGRTVVSGHEDGLLRIWDASTCKVRWTLEGHGKSVTSVAWSNDTFVISGSLDQTVRTWDAKTGRLKNSYQGHSAAVLCVASSSDGTRVASGSEDQSIILWSASDYKEIARLIGHSQAVISVAFSNTEHLVSGSADGTVRVWDTGGICLSVFYGHSGGVDSTQFSPDGAWVASASGDRTVRTWDASMTGEQGSRNWVMNVAISSDTLRVFSGSTNGVLGLWNARNGKLISKQNAHKGRINFTAVSPDDMHVATSSVDCTIGLWNVHGDDLVLAHRLSDHSASVHCVDFSRDGDFLVSASEDCYVRVWDTRRGTCLRSLPRHDGGVGVATFSPDGLTIVSGSFDSTIRVWNTKSGEMLGSFSNHPSPVLWVAYAPQGNYIVAWYEDEHVGVWKICRAPLSYEPVPYREWRLDRTTDGASGPTMVLYETLVKSDAYYYLQEDGWLTHAFEGRRICWIPPSRRPAWLRSLWLTRGRLFVMGSQTGGLTILDLESED